MTEIKEAEQRRELWAVETEGSKVRRLLAWSSHGGRLLGAMVRSWGFLRIVRDTRSGVLESENVTDVVTFGLDRGLCVGVCQAGRQQTT